MAESLTFVSSRHFTVFHFHIFQKDSNFDLSALFRMFHPSAKMMMGVLVGVKRCTVVG